MFWMIVLLIAPTICYIGLIIYSSLPERLYPRVYPVKPICTKPSCARCNTNQALLARAKFFYDEVYNGTGRIKQSLEASTNNSEPLVFRFNGLRARPSWHPAQYGKQITADIASLEENFVSIKLEALNLLARYTNRWIRNAETDGSNWFVYPILNQGDWNDTNATSCPETVSILLNMKSIMDKCVFGNIFFSILPPNTKIETHRGATNMRLRCHLCLETSQNEESCKLVVGDAGAEETLHWSEGKCFVFDDSFPHSVESTTSTEERIALVLDFWHPDITESERYIFRRMFPDVPNQLT